MSGTQNDGVGDRSALLGENPRGAAPRTPQGPDMDDRLEDGRGLRGRGCGACFQYSRLFLESSELAIRAVVILYLVALPLMLSLGKEADTQAQFFDRNAMFDTRNIAIFIYTLYHTFGQTVQKAGEAMLGALMAALAASALFTAFPEGVDTDGPGGRLASLVVGHASGPLFAMFILFLNFALRTQQFALANWAVHWMAFMKPGQHAQSLKILGVETSLYAFDDILTQLVGVCLAILATLLPCPLFATRKAKDVAEAIVERVSETWLGAVDFYCKEELNERMQPYLQHHVKELDSQVDSLKAHLKNSWWEQPFYCKWRHVSRCMARLEKLTRQVYDRLNNVLDTCTREKFEDNHDKFVRQCREEMVQAVRGASALFRSASKKCMEGGFPSKSEEELRTFRQQIDKVRLHERVFTQEFIRVKHVLGMPYLSRDLLEEHVFGFEVSRYCDLICTFSKELIEDSEATHNGDRAASPWAKEHKELTLCNAFRGVCDFAAITDREHLNLAFLNTVTFLVCWYIGYHGWDLMVLAYDPNVAKTAAVLLSKYPGSAVVKNLNRLQGVVLGLVVGEMIYALFGRCHPLAYTGLSVSFFLFIGGSLHMYYSKSNYAYTARLMATFGAKKLVRGCDATSIDPTRTLTYYPVIDMVTSVFVLGIVDLTLSLRPSMNAYRAFDQVFAEIQSKLGSVLMDGEAMTPEIDSSIQSAIDKAILMAREAAVEPRFWRTPWKADLWRSGIKCALDCQAYLHCLIYAVSVEQTGGQAKEYWYLQISRLPSFQKLQKFVLEKFSLIRRLSKVFIHEEASRMPEVVDTRIDYDKVEELVVACMDEANKSVLPGLAKAHSAGLFGFLNGDKPDMELLGSIERLEDEPNAQVASMLACVRKQTQALKDFHLDIYKS